ncbi:metallophosphoesterase domain-containing protein 1-like [Saccostrea cucullata]|uniref:metallophosphoesterase domain-containing protein 1-like n=1 Tax=Saccostrea cuccullata TaxID=36930 RepID=UPI002ED3D71D
MKDEIPEGDVLLHAGDFTNVGWPGEVKELNDILGQLPHKHKIVIAGNHDLTFDDEMLQNDPEAFEKFGLNLEKVKTDLTSVGVNSAKELLTNCLYLEDACVELYGIKIHGSPWQPEFCDWGFNLPRGQPCLSKWDLIPCDTDILITHGPPLEIARRLQIPRSTITSVVDRYRKRGSVENIPRKGKQAKLSDRDSRSILRLVKKTERENYQI